MGLTTLICRKLGRKLENLGPPEHEILPLVLVGRIGAFGTVSLKRDRLCPTTRAKRQCHEASPKQGKRGRLGNLHGRFYSAADQANLFDLFDFSAGGVEGKPAKAIACDCQENCCQIPPAQVSRPDRPNRP
jgi:hypothetical protein